jgi:hypothetical protein
MTRIALYHDYRNRGYVWMRSVQNIKIVIEAGIILTCLGEFESCIMRFDRGSTKLNQANFQNLLVGF